MKKIESIWHYLLFSALHSGKFQHTQQEIADTFGYSLSTIHHALKIPSSIGAIRKSSKFFVLSNFKKLLYYFASFRNLERDIIYKVHVDQTVTQIEGFVPPESIFACYSAARKILKEPPADYAKVYIYINSDELDVVKERFPSPSQKRMEPNLMVLKKHLSMQRYGVHTTLPQTFVDIWNLEDWYGQDFTNALEEKMKELNDEILS